MNSEVVSRLNVYVVHDDPEGHCSYNDDRHWMAIAADCERDAVVIAAAVYDGEAPHIDWDWTKAFAVSDVINQDAIAKWPERLRPYHPCQLRDCESLRLVGFYSEGESRCEACELYAMGMDKYSLCPECDVCHNCGCECKDADNARH